MDGRTAWTIAGAIALAACGGDNTPEGDSGGKLPPATLDAAAAADNGDRAAIDPGSTTPATAASPSTAGESRAVPAGELTAYVGKFPNEPVEGLTWSDHPLVVAGIRKTVTDPAVLEAMRTPGGPTAPIATYQGKVGSWGCQPHNCGDHQWAVLVEPGSGATDVCYHNAAQTGESSRWFLAEGRVETRSGNCSVV